MNNIKTFVEELLHPYYENDSTTKGYEPSTSKADSTRMDEDSVDQFSDGLAMFGIVVLFLSIGAFLAFIVYQRYRSEVDARLHPYHQEYEHHKLDKQEQLENEELIREVEANSAIDFQAYIGAWASLFLILRLIK